MNAAVAVESECIISSMRKHPLKGPILKPFIEKATAAPQEDGVIFACDLNGNVDCKGWLKLTPPLRL